MTTAPESDYQSIKVPSAQATQQIIVIARALHGKTEAPMVDCLYEATKEFVKIKLPPADKKDLFSIIFSHYIEAYRGWRYSDALMNNKADGLNVILLHNEAAVSVLGLYPDHHNDAAIRRMVVYAVNALHQVSVAYHSFGAEKDIKLSITDLGNMALITQTVSAYVKGRNIPSNIPYIAYLKTFFEQTLVDPDLKFVATDETFKSVIDQLTKNVKVIKV